METKSADYRVHHSVEEKKIVFNEGKLLYYNICPDESVTICLNLPFSIRKNTD